MREVHVRLRLAKGAGPHEVAQSVFAYLLGHPLCRVRELMGGAADLVVEHLLNVAHDRHGPVIERNFSVEAEAASGSIEAAFQTEFCGGSTAAFDFFPPSFERQSAGKIDGDFGERLLVLVGKQRCSSVVDGGGFVRRGMLLGEFRTRCCRGKPRRE